MFQTDFGGSAPGSARSEAKIVDRVIRERYASRFFLDRPVAPADLLAILDVARHAPSGGNIQPWRVHVLGGSVKDELSALMLATHERDPGKHTAEYSYYPADLPEPYAARKFKFGAAFYGSLGIAQSDDAARLRQTGRNFLFFDAPIGLIFTIDRRLAAGSWLDLGMFIQNIMLAARARGLDTCPQETLARYHALLREHLPILEHELVVCGMSMGFADATRLADQPRMARVPLEEIASFHGL